MYNDYTMSSTTTIRVKEETAEALRRRGHKGETYDQILRRMLATDFLNELDERYEKGHFIPAEEIPWDKLRELSEEEIDELLESL
ncbi:hypothetical protein AKJ42_00720 [candidate division MSBL1 archaeon SCGC-AAA261C02]|uniref:Uncharacterized protein n=1 Tax=candidate division MSBL1 archaeon SCGC-AAA261C02 TaxID=1698272 RepID=A0A133V1X1_9EURY|nr:hypothetical protein AKJ42_00720 [candidate division MSBL1 archaeon SCGC-AAA261C02]